MLNVGEQFLGTIVQALPEVMLPQYLPEGVEVRLPHRGLMVARPMQQSQGNATKDSWMLWKSSNPTTLRYANTHYKESLDEGRRTQVAQQQIAQIQTKRVKSKKAHLFREPNESLGDILSMMR